MISPVGNEPSADKVEYHRYQHYEAEVKIEGENKVDHGC